MKILIFSCLVVVGLGFEDKTVTQYLADNGFTTLSAALSTAGLSSALDGSGPYTVFAPTNAAFAAQGFNISAYTREQLATVLKYHVIAKFVLVPMVTTPRNETTLEQQALLIEKAGSSLLLNGKARVDSSNNDIIVNNGVIQPIDTVLSPPVFVTHNIYQVLLREDTKFNDLSLALLLSGLVSTVEGNEFTFFAPTDAAFAVYKDNLLNPAAPNAQHIYQEVLKYHLVPGARHSSELRNGQKLYTLHGTPVNVTVGAGVVINNANVIEADMQASNGVIHAIDKLLVPQDIYQIASGN
ncbi:transforming growth factor-beta-induced protein ig-h3-like isoform X2 [Mercenaria mercenaria]|uniref:transforming growth factor-beta-induced protein ig-h3-like isoform X2 n=1 Tax=Mercenaria mercenaria TaxID=6596 RepID=UPI00234EDDBF|nr:transforming growth factor-beta-induced protein ig-h3-like isoform X2 [Mercenaria mercenaria]